MKSAGSCRLARSCRCHRAALHAANLLSSMSKRRAQTLIFLAARLRVGPPQLGGTSLVGRRVAFEAPLTQNVHKAHTTARPLHPRLPDRPGKRSNRTLARMHKMLRPADGFAQRNTADAHLCAVEESRCRQTKSVVQSSRRWSTTTNSRAHLQRINPFSRLAPLFQAGQARAAVTKPA